MRNSYSCFQEHFRLSGCKGKAIYGVGKQYQEVYHCFVTTREATCDRIGKRGLFGVAPVELKPYLLCQILLNEYDCF